MNKIILLLLLVLQLISCRNEGVYHTYYGDICIDTMQAIIDEGSPSYIVRVRPLDSIQAKAMGLEEVIEVIFYKPLENEYFMQMYGNDGGESARIYFNPLKDN